MIDRYTLKQESGSVVRDYLIPLCVAILCFGFAATSTAQVKGIKPVGKKETAKSGVTRAVVVGISDYQNEDIPDLRFADRDAEIFADYLQSTEGGGLAEEHITVLLNEKATAGQFVAALYGLVEDSKEGDHTIIYFSGHGDVETATISQPGFLLCWDAPYQIYMGGGTFGLGYLQEIISTLSQKTKSKVIMISDACRAGKLAGSRIGGAQATAANLAKQYANEIKILSCQPNEFALESETWGGGRGVFSYYFLAGLQGLADRNDDNIITLSEIDRYLEDHVTPDVAPHSQIPMVVGNRQTELSVVTPELKARTLASMEELELSPIADRNTALTASDFSDSTKYDTYVAFTKALQKGHLLYPEEGSAWQLYETLSQYEEVSSRLGLMRRNLAAALQDDAQQAINRYLSADQQELNKRLHFDQSYQRYPEALSKAASLLTEEHFFYKPIMSRYYYFTGLNYRQQAQQLASDSLYRVALVYQDSALQYEPQAVHCTNEKGFTHYLLGEHELALQKFDEAIEQIPNWPLVYVNQSLVYNKEGKWDKAIHSAEKAIAIDSSFVLAYYSIGMAYQGKKEFETAKTILKNAIDLTSYPADLYYKLGYIAYLEKDYPAAEKYYLDGIANDGGGDIKFRVNLGHLYLTMDRTADAKEVFTAIRNDFPEHILGYQVMIEYSYHIGDLAAAGTALEEYIGAFPNDGYAYYLLASVTASKGDYDGALGFVRQAFENKFDAVDTLENDGYMKPLLQMEGYKALKQKYIKEQ